MITRANGVVLANTGGLDPPNIPGSRAGRTSANERGGWLNLKNPAMGRKQTILADSESVTYAHAAPRPPAPGHFADRRSMAIWGIPTWAHT